MGGSDFKELKFLMGKECTRMLAVSSLGGDPWGCGVVTVTLGQLQPRLVCPEWKNLPVFLCRSHYLHFFWAVSKNKVFFSKQKVFHQEKPRVCPCPWRQGVWRGCLGFDSLTSRFVGQVPPGPVRHLGSRPSAVCQSRWSRHTCAGET